VVDLTVCSTSDGTSLSKRLPSTSASCRRTRDSDVRTGTTPVARAARSSGTGPFGCAGCALA
jgi:hypothetical protein